MDTMEISVIIGGVGLIGLTLWYFFGERTGIRRNERNRCAK